MTVTKLCRTSSLNDISMVDVKYKTDVEEKKAAGVDNKIAGVFYQWTQDTTCHGVRYIGATHSFFRR